MPEIDVAMRSASVLPAGPERRQAWARINHDVAAAAPGVPYVWDDTFQFESGDVAGRMNPYYGTWDLSFTSLR